MQNFNALVTEVLNEGISPEELEARTKNNAEMRKMTQDFIKRVTKLVKPQKAKKKTKSFDVVWEMYRGGEKSYMNKVEVSLTGIFGKKDHTNVVHSTAVMAEGRINRLTFYKPTEGDSSMVEFQINDLKVYKKYLDDSYDQIEAKLKEVL
jgi:hypothetical protein